MTKRPELVNTKKTGGKDLDLQRAVHSNGKGALTVCLSVCMCECVRASKSVRGSLAVILSPGDGGTLFLIRVSPSPGVGHCFICPSVCQPWHPMSWSATNLLSSLLKI